MPETLRFECIKPLSILNEKEPLQLKPADVVFVFSDGFGGWLIRMWTRRRREKVAVNHVAMVIEAPCTILDAQPPVVQPRNFRKRYAGMLVAIYRPVLEESMRQAIADDCRRRYSGRLYGWTKILLQVLGLGRFSCIDGLPICSYSVAVPFGAYVYRFGRLLPRSATPDAMFDAVRAHLMQPAVRG